MTERQMHPDFVDLWDRLEAISTMIDSAVEAVTGKRQAFALAIASPEPGFKGLTITNATEWPGAIAQLEAGLAALRDKHAKETP